MLQQLIEIKEKYGLRRYVLIGPYPKSAVGYKLTAYRELGKQIKKVKDKLQANLSDNKTGFTVKEPLAYLSPLFLKLSKQ
jgi:hypothetical protein